MKRKIEKCKVCGSWSWTDVYPEVLGFRIDRKFAIHRCADCRTVATSHPLTGKELASYYDSQPVASNGKSEDEWVEDYLRNREDYWYKLGYYNRLAEIRRIFPKAKKILDIGCDAGFFLDFLREHGYETFGLEVSERCHAIATKKLKLNVKKAQVSELAKGELPPIDVVTMYDVLEHTEDPRSDLVAIKEIMEYDGKIIINLPNLDSFISRVTGAQWNKLIPPSHTFFFTAKTLRHLVEEVDYDFVSVSTNNGTASELASELGTSLWRLLGFIFTPIADAYACKDLPFGEHKSILVAMVKLTKKLCGYLGFLVVPLMPFLTLFKKGEGLHLIAEKEQYYTSGIHLNGPLKFT